MSTFNDDQSRLISLTAIANVRGSAAFPNIRGTVRFVQSFRGVMVHADIIGLPQTAMGFFGFHLHEKRCGSPLAPTPFSESGGHYNPGNLSHPRHAGDFPNLLETAEGNARLSFLTDRFNVLEIIGRSVVIHLEPDDYRSQPAGMSGNRIACGVITPHMQPRYE